MVKGTRSVWGVLGVALIVAIMGATAVRGANLPYANFGGNASQYVIINTTAFPITFNLSA